MECELLLVTVFNSSMQLAFLVFTKNFLLPCDFIFRRLRQLGGNVTVA